MAKTAPEPEAAEDIAKSITMPPALWIEVEPYLEAFDVSFAQFARVAIRERVARLNDEKKVSRR